MNRQIFISKTFNILTLFLLSAFLESGLAGSVTITDKGARGDAVHICVNTDSNSDLVTSYSTTFSTGDIGKVIEIFGAGESTAGTNHTDLIARIVKIVGEHGFCVSPLSGATTTNATAVYGTDNAPIFQEAVDSANGTNTIIRIPKGNYLLIPPAHFTHALTKTLGAILISRGGIHFKGEGMGRTILTGCGAWELNNDKKAYRGFLFVCRGPVINDYPLAFENLTMDGGVNRGNTENHGFPASPVDGSGWDLFHSAVVDIEPSPLHSIKQFKKCEFVHWRGEILKSTCSWAQGFIQVSSCEFRDGNASAFNFSFAHHIEYCTFSKLMMAMEFYEGRMGAPSSFDNCKVSDVNADMVIVGALTTHPSPSYTIRNNIFQSSGFGILLGPAENLTISCNHFDVQGFGIGSGSGYQGTAPNRNISITGNVFDHVHRVFHVGAAGSDRFENVVISNNTVLSGDLAGGYAYSTNVLLTHNRCLDSGRAIDGASLTGQWFIDDLSNLYRPRKVVYEETKSPVLSYAYGARQETVTSRTNAVFLIDDSSPDKIPAGAQMVITHMGPQSASLFLSSTRSNQPVAAIMTPGSVINCFWTNMVWKIEYEAKAAVK